MFNFDQEKFIKIFNINLLDSEKLVISQTADFVKKTLWGEGSGHDWWHIYRVWQNSLHLAKYEGGNLFVIQLAALLHDIADWKFYGGDQNAGVNKSREYLESIKVDQKIVDHVCYIIRHLSFKGAKTKVEKMTTIEGMIVQDADRLDAIGAIGIARAFTYGGHMNREMYNPEIEFELHETAEKYIKSQGTSVNHFYEKLLLLKDLMNTKTAKEIAQKRHEFMEEYLKQFFIEWECKDF